MGTEHDEDCGHGHHEDKPGAGDNIERMYRATLKFIDRLVNKNRLLFWLLALGAAITYGVTNREDLLALMEGLSRFIPAVGGAG